MLKYVLVNKKNKVVKVIGTLDFQNDEFIFTYDSHYKGKSIGYLELEQSNGNVFKSKTLFNVFQIRIPSHGAMIRYEKEIGHKISDLSVLDKLYYFGSDGIDNFKFIK